MCQYSAFEASAPLSKIPVKTYHALLANATRLVLRSYGAMV